MTRCARKGCTGTIREAGGKFCSAKCAAKSGWGKVNGHGRKPQKAPSKPVVAATSWWVTCDPRTFYAEAGTRFPETGTAEVSRGKVQLYAADSKGRTA